VANAFNDSINARDLDALAALMTDDHAFVDTEGVAVQGKAACVDAWRGFFEQFPDYRNTFEHLRAWGDQVVIVGFSSCSFAPLDGPALWQADVRDERVARWQVFEDTPAPRAPLGIA